MFHLTLNPCTSNPIFLQEENLVVNYAIVLGASLNYAKLQSVQLLAAYALRINGYLPVWMSGSKINSPGSKMTCPDFCLNHLTLSDAQFLGLLI